MFWLRAWSGLTVAGLLGLIAWTNSIRFRRGVASEVRQLCSAQSGPSPLEPAGLVGSHSYGCGLLGTAAM